MTDDRVHLEVGDLYDLTPDWMAPHGPTSC